MPSWWTLKKYLLIDLNEDKSSSKQVWLHVECNTCTGWLGLEVSVPTSWKINLKRDCRSQRILCMDSEEQAFGILILRLLGKIRDANISIFEPLETGLQEQALPQHFTSFLSWSSHITFLMPIFHTHKGHTYRFFCLATIKKENVKKTYPNVVNYNINLRCYMTSQSKDSIYPERGYWKYPLRVKNCNSSNDVDINIPKLKINFEESI